MRLSIILIITLIVISINFISAGGVGSHVFTSQHYQNSFIDWMRKNDKSYSHSEFSNKYEAFKKNMDFIHNWNTNGNSKTVLGLTNHADLSNEEYRMSYLGTKSRVNLGAGVKKNRNIGGLYFKKPIGNVDWREKGAVTPVKDQGQCGSCYSFSTSGAVEGFHAITEGKLVSLSEQNILDCSSSYGNEGCNGGLMTSSFEFIIDQGGLATEASYPYEMKVNDQCNFVKKNIGAKINSYREINAGDENDLQNALLLNPVSVAIDASHQSFQLYTSGVYYEPSCSSEELDHGVLVVGMGTEDGSDYYIVKNSWGTTWGVEGGYIHMARNKENNCGIASMASYPTK